MPVLDAYVDGGVCGRNPSPKGGSWAVVYVLPDTGETVEISGHFTPEELGMKEIENNLSETMAVAAALLNVPDGYTLRTIYGDNANAIRRGERPEKGAWSKVPVRVRDDVKAARKRHRETRFVLIGGTRRKRTWPAVTG